MCANIESAESAGPQIEDRLGVARRRRRVVLVDGRRLTPRQPGQERGKLTGHPGIRPISVTRVADGLRSCGGFVPDDGLGRWYQQSRGSGLRRATGWSGSPNQSSMVRPTKRAPGWGGRPRVPGHGSVVWSVTKSWRSCTASSHACNVRASIDPSPLFNHRQAYEPVRRFPSERNHSMSPSTAIMKPAGTTSSIRDESSMANRSASMGQVHQQ